MSQQKIGCCLKCGSVNFIKKGNNTNGKQRYFCNDCKKYFQSKAVLPSWVQKAYTDYAVKGMIYKDLTIKYNKSIPTLTKYFDLLGMIKRNKYIEDVNNKKRPLMAAPISLLLDATFFKRYK